MIYASFSMLFDGTFFAKMAAQIISQLRRWDWFYL